MAPAASQNTQYCCSLGIPLNLPVCTASRLVPDLRLVSTNLPTRNASFQPRVGMVTYDASIISLGCLMLIYVRRIGCCCTCRHQRCLSRSVTRNFTTVRHSESSIPISDTLLG